MSAACPPAMRGRADVDSDDRETRAVLAVAEREITLLDKVISNVRLEEHLRLDASRKRVCYAITAAACRDVLGLPST